MNPTGSSRRCPQSTSGRRVRVVFALPLLLFLLLSSLTASSFAQTSGTPAVTPASGSKTEAAESGAASNGSAPALTARPGDLVYLLDRDGQLRAIPAGATIEAFQEWLEKQGRAQAARPIDFYVASVTLDGRVDPERPVVHLDASFDIVVRATDSEVRIPLRLNEATLIGHAHDGPGMLAVVPGDRAAGLACRVSEPGKYRLRLQLSVPVRRNAGQQRLQLSLPESAQSSLGLAVPGSGITVRAGDNADLETRPNADGTEIRMYGLGTALDLNWQVVPQRIADRAELQVQTLVSLQVTADEVLADCVLTASSLSGTFESLVFDLPAGFQIDSLISPTHPGIKYEDPQFNSTRIQLPTATAGPVELRVKLSSERKTDNEPVLISGLQVKGATRQECLLGLSLAEGFRLADDQDGIKPLQRIGMTSFRRIAESRLGTPPGFGQAWRVPPGPYQAELKVERIAPSFLVLPSYELKVGEATLDLTAVFEVEVYRGEIDSIRMRWPGFENQHWELRTTASPLAFDVTNGAEPDVVVLQLATPRNRTHGKGRIELQYRRPISPGDEPFLLSLPDPEVTRRGITRMKVQNAANIESGFEPFGKTVARLVSIEGDQKLLAALPENQRDRIWEIEAPAPQFLVTVNSHSQSLSVETLAVVTVSEDRMRVEQTFDYTIAYERLSHLRLLVPPGVTTGQFSLKTPATAEPVTLIPSGSSFATEVEREIRLDLPELLWGRFQVLCQYSVPIENTLSENQESRVLVPLTQTGDASASRTRVEVRSPGNVTTRVKEADTDWKAELALAGAPVWSAEGAARSLPLELLLAPNKASENFRIPRAALRTRFDQGGMRTQAAYLIEGSITYLTVVFPDGAQLPSVRAWWNGAELRIDSSNAVTREIRLELNAAGGGTRHLLAFEWTADLKRSIAPMNHFKIKAPQFASDVWVAETLWDVVLPYDQHLLVYPDNYMPRFRWRREAVVWSRRTIDSLSSLREWLQQPLPSTVSGIIPAAASSESTSTEETPLLPADLLLGNADSNGYLFSSFGHQEELELRSMSQPAIVLAGAGLALLLGFVLLRIPATRHILTFLLLGFAMSLAGLWHPEAVALLIQPALCGLVLAMAAALFESRIKRKQQAALASFSSPSDFVQQYAQEEGEVRVTPASEWNDLSATHARA